jgi:hypothetical protein
MNSGVSRQARRAWRTAKLFVFGLATWLLAVPSHPRCGPRRTRSATVGADGTGLWLVQPGLRAGGNGWSECGYDGDQQEVDREEHDEH